MEKYRVSNRRYRNRRIGDFLKELHLTEGRNTGFKKILDALEANGSPKPEFETDDDHSYFITRLFIHEEFIKEETGVGNAATPKSTPSTPLILESMDMGEVKLREQILRLISYDEKISKKKITEILGISMYTLKKELSAMGEERVAEFVGFSRNGKWVVYSEMENREE